MYSRFIFDPTQAIESFELIPEGNHKAKIIKVEEQISKNGNEMLVIFIQPNGYKFPLKHYITLSNLNSAENQNRGLAQKLLVELHDSFEIPYDKEKPQELNFTNWIGRSGGIEVKHKLYDGKTLASIKKCIIDWTWKPTDLLENIANDRECITENGKMQFKDDNEDIPF